MTRYDWEKIRDHYVLGDVTLEDLAEQPGAPSSSTIRKRAASERWTNMREQHRNRVAARTRDISVTDEATLATQQMRIGKAVQTIGLNALRAFRPEDLTPRDAIELVKVGHRMQLDSFAFQADREAPDGTLLAALEAMATPVEPGSHLN